MIPSSGGGCTVQNPFVPYNASAPVGRDCTAIGGVDSVQCAHGTCLVESCLSGWAVNDAKDGCALAPNPGASEDALVLQSPAKRKRVFSRLFV